MAARSPEEDHLFRGKPSSKVHPDSVSPCVEGYFSIPPTWIGEEPDSALIKTLNPKIHYEGVINRKLSSNVEAMVLRDGTFLFDFSEWSLAPTITIPGYRIAEDKTAIAPEAHMRAEQQAESHAALRAQLLNVHQLCLMSASMLVDRWTVGRWHPVTAWNTIKAAAFGPPPSQPNYQDPHSVVHLAANSRFGLGDGVSCGRQVVNEAVVQKSLDLLDAVLSQEETTVIAIMEAIYLAGCRAFERRYGEALVLAWAACEQMLSTEWDSLLCSKEGLTENKHQRMNADRRKKLTGRDYTASVMTEVLELEGRIDYNLYRQLEVARKCRNNWMHRMELPKHSEVRVCVSAALALVNRIWNIDIPEFTAGGGRGGGPSYFVWAWEQFKGRPAPPAEL